MPTDYRSLYGKEWLGAWDLQDKDVTVTITAVAGAELTAPGNRKSKKPALSIRGTEKKLALNATNGKTIATLYGPHIENWIDKRVTLYKSTTRSPDGAGEVECVRIRPRVPPPKQPSQDFTPAPPVQKPLGEDEQATPTEAEALMLLTRDWIDAINGCRDADTVSQTADDAPEKVRGREEFATAVKAKLDALKERK